MFAAIETTNPRCFGGDNEGGDKQWKRISWDKRWYNETNDVFAQQHSNTKLTFLLIKLIKMLNNMQL